MEDLLNQIQPKLEEIWNNIQTIPDCCKGSSDDASANRRIYMTIRTLTFNLLQFVDNINKNTNYERFI